jgi:hypothetical protein
MIRGLFAGAVVFCFLLFLGNADAALIHGKDYQNPNGDQVVRVNSSGQMTQTLQSGEDQANSVMKTEQQFSYCLDDADIVCKASPGFVHSISCWGEDAAATAGRVQLRDATAAGAGTVVWGQEFAAAIASPSSVILDIVMTTGIVIDWDTTADVMCTVSYR